MTEKREFQLPLNLKESLTASHVMLRGAHILVPTNSGYTWSVLTSNQAQIKMIPRKEEHQHKKGLRFFTSIDSFMVRHLEANVPRHYEGKTSFYGFERPEDNTIRKLPQQKIK